MSIRAKSGARFTQQQVVQPILIGIVSLLLLGPLLILIKTSVSPANTMPLDSFKITFLNYVTAFSSSDTYYLILNTIRYAFGSVLLALTVATCLSWLVERTDLPLRDTIRVLMFSWMAVPPLVMSFGWILLLNPGSGTLNVALQHLFGLTKNVFNVYTMKGMIFISGMGLVPTAFVMISGALRNMDPQLENAATVSGAGRLTVMRHVTVPLIAPSLLSVGIYVLMVMIQAFDIPLAIGLTARVPVLSTRIYLLSTPENSIPQYGLSAAFGVSLLILAIFLMRGYFRFTRIGEKFRVVTGRGFRPRRLSLGRWRFVGLGVVLLYAAVMFLPLLILLWASFLRFFQSPSLDTLSQVSLNNYIDLLHQPMIRRALGNTLLLVFSSATIVMLLSGLISWFSVRSKGRMAKILDTLAFTPMAVPHIVMAIALLLLYIRTPLYGSLALLILGHVTIYLAFGTRTMNGALIQIHQELENAATVSGAAWTTTLRRILFPLIWPQALYGWFWVIAHSMRDLTVPLMLMTTSNVVMSSALWLTWGAPNIPGAAALAMIMVLGFMVLVVPIQIIMIRKMGHNM